MIRTAIVLVILLATPHVLLAQFGGNIGFAPQGSGAKTRAEQMELGKRVLTTHELPPTGTSMYIDANILMNVKADEYVAMFAVSQEAETVAECGKKMDGVVKTFADELRPLGISGDNLFVDFVAQTKVYRYEVTGNTAREKLAGFELKKNVSLRFQDQKLLDKLLAAAAKVQIYDLIKVDYVVKDTAKVNDRLLDEAARIIKQKSGRYEKLLGVKLQNPPQIYAERAATHFPSKLYDSYVAQESEEVDAGFLRNNFTIHNVRKSRTFYFNGLDGNGFDGVINPVIVEPVVQFTLYLKVKYELESGKSK